MTVQGNLRTMMVPDVLQWLSQGQQTGILHIRGTQGITKKIFFDRGAIVSTASSDPREYLGQFLISRGYLSEDQLNKAMETQIQTGIMLGKILISVGILEERELQEVLRLKAEENIYDLFLWEEGDFRFEDLPTQASDIPRVSLDVMSLVMEGIRRKDEWGRIRGIFANDRAILQPTAKPFVTADWPPNSLPTRAYIVFDGHRCMAEAMLELHTTEFQLAEAAFKLHEKGLVKVGGEKERPEEKSYANLRKGFLEEAAKALEERRFSEAVNLFRYLARNNDQDEEIRKGPGPRRGGPGPGLLQRCGSTQHRPRTGHPPQGVDPQDGPHASGGVPGLSRQRKLGHRLHPQGLAPLGAGRAQSDPEAARSRDSPAGFTLAASPFPHFSLPHEGGSPGNFASA